MTKHKKIPVIEPCSTIEETETGEIVLTVRWYQIAPRYRGISPGKMTLAMLKPNLIAAARQADTVLLVTPDSVVSLKGEGTTLV